MTTKEKVLKELKKKRRRYYCKNGELHTEEYVILWEDVIKIFKDIK